MCPRFGKLFGWALDLPSGSQATGNWMGPILVRLAWVEKVEVFLRILPTEHLTLGDKSEAPCHTQYAQGEGSPSIEGAEGCRYREVLVDKHHHHHHHRQGDEKATSSFPKCEMSQDA